jgi:hypothetical protein
VDLLTAHVCITGRIFSRENHSLLQQSQYLHATRVEGHRVWPLLALLLLVPGVVVLVRVAPARLWGALLLPVYL